jgi:nicotinate-nucleotide pyrophosphorylase (carboxylating)
MWDPELGDVDDIIDRALREDLAAGDVTARATVAPTLRAKAALVAKQDTVVCGLAVAGRVFTRLDPNATWTALHTDGTKVAAKTVLATVEGNARAVLGAERTALNLVQRMCGIASTVRRYVDAAAGRCRVTDTRKTTPGLRSLDRYAVRTGGGHNHRNDLGSGVLIKENHIRCAGSIATAIVAARAHAPHGLRIECEVTNLDEVKQALAARADVILLDNMDDGLVAQAVLEVAGRALTEVSGNVDLERIDRVAALGIDLVSVGALTHSVKAADLSLLFEYTP